MGWIVNGVSFVPLVTVYPSCPHNLHHNIKPQHESSVQNVQTSISFLGNHVVVVVVVLRWAILRFVVVCCLMLSYTLRNVVLCCAMSSYVGLCSVMLRHVVVCCGMLLYVLQCCVMLSFDAICCAVLWYVLLGMYY